MLLALAAGSTSARAREPDPQPQSGTGDEGRLVTVRWNGRPSLRIGRFARLDLRARFQIDRRRSDAPFDPGDSDPLQTTKRIGVDGEIARLFGFQIEREFGDDDDPWRDVYVNYQQLDSVQIQYGKFKLPFGLDENTSAVNLDFVGRSRLADQLSPSRDRGAMVHGQVLDRTLRYEIGVFEHDGVNARRRESDRVHGARTLAGRVAARPFRRTDSSLNDLHFAIAFTRTDLPEGFSALHGKTALGAEFYEPAVWVRGRRLRLGLEARWRPGPFSLKAEYVRLTDERREESVEVTDLPPALAVGWYLSGTWALTGERKAAGLEEPRRPITRGGLGAIELAARAEALSFGSVGSHGLLSTSPRADVVLGNRLRVTTAGVNWHPMQWIKLQVNLIHESIARPDQGPLPERRSFWSRVVRLQFAM